MSRSFLVALVSLAALVPTGACAGATSPGGVQGPPFGQEQADVVLEGYVEVIIEDADRGSRTLYFLLSDDGRIALRFSVDPPNLTTGTRVRVRGSYQTDGTFVVATLERLPEG